MQARVPSASLGSLSETQNLHLCSDSLHQNLIVDRIAGDWNRISDPRGTCTGQRFLCCILPLRALERAIVWLCLQTSGLNCREGGPWQRFFKISQRILMQPRLKLTGGTCLTEWESQEKKVWGYSLGAANQSQVDLNSEACKLPPALRGLCYLPRCAEHTSPHMHETTHALR